MACTQTCQKQPHKNTDSALHNAAIPSSYIFQNNRSEKEIFNKSFRFGLHNETRRLDVLVDLAKCDNGCLYEEILKRTKSFVVKLERKYHYAT
jgi:hypothetical protein